MTDLEDLIGGLSFFSLSPGCSDEDRDWTSAASVFFPSIRFIDWLSWLNLSNNLTLLKQNATNWQK